MLHSIVQLLEFTVQAANGVRGRVIDAYFDQDRWQLSCFLVAVGAVSEQRAIVVPRSDLSIAPDQHLIRARALSTFDGPMAAQLSHLRSARKMLECEVAGWTGSLGLAEDGIIDTASWEMRFLVVDISGCAGDGVVAIETGLIEEMSLPQQAIRIALTREELSPEMRADDAEPRRPTVFH